jgi:hypothetical protein
VNEYQKVQKEGESLFWISDRMCDGLYVFEIWGLPKMVVDEMGEVDELPMLLSATNRHHP